MKKLFLLFLLPVVAGCLSSAPKAPVKWNIDADTGLEVSTVSVAAPFDVETIAVMRQDGSLVFDYYNVFAERPARLVKNAVKVGTVGPALTVRHLALDCREPNRRRAYVTVRLDGDGKTANGEGIASAADRNYTRAFSEALATAIGKAAAEYSKE